MGNDFKEFFKENKKQKEHVKYAATASICGKDGKPLEWELKPVTSKDNDRIREECTEWQNVPGKNIPVSHISTSDFNAKLICASVVYPDLGNTALQNSYGVLKPEELIQEMVDDPGEYMALLLKVQEISGFTSLAEDVEEAKN